MQPFDSREVEGPQRSGGELDPACETRRRPPPIAVRPVSPSVPPLIPPPPPAAGAGPRAGRAATTRRLILMIGALIDAFTRDQFARRAAQQRPGVAAAVRGEGEGAQPDVRHLQQARSPPPPLSLRRPQQARPSTQPPTRPRSLGIAPHAPARLAAVGALPSSSPLGPSRRGAAHPPIRSPMQFLSPLPHLPI